MDSVFSIVLGGSEAVACVAAVAKASADLCHFLELLE